MDKQETPIITTTGREINKEILSPDKTKKLVLTFNQGINSRIAYKYLVVNSKTNTEILRGDFTGIRLDWNDNTSLKGYLYQGIEANDTNIETSKFVIIKLEK